MEQKMYQTTVIETLDTDSQVAIEQSIQRLDSAGLQVMRSFDLKVARAAHIECACPHHGTDQCDCQMVVLLVYGQDGSPATLVVHGHDGQVQIALVDTPEQRPDSQLVATIMRALPTKFRKEIFKMAIDPVCGMQVDEKSAAATYEYQGKTYYFCAPGCKAAFVKEPEKYLHASTGHGGHESHGHPH
jgi:YHS domain-containing protein